MGLRLSEEFLSKYKSITPAWGPLGWITYMRTYSRWIEEENRREEYWETIRRVVEGDLARMDLAGDPRPDEEKLAEAERMYHYFFHFGITPSGRNLWQSGTEFERRRGGDALNNCFAAGTLVHTEDGVIPIESLVGKTVNVLSQGGVYRPATFTSYGVQSLMEVELANGDVIVATPEHLWVRWMNGKVSTNRVMTRDLKPGDQIPLVRPQLPDVDPVGIAHGFVYGDGTKVGNTTRVTICTKEKEAIIPYLLQCGGVEAPETADGFKQVRNLPGDWKTVPGFEKGKGYALGFIIGLISADGSVNKRNGIISISSANREALEQIRRLALWVGLRANQIRVERELSPFDGSYKPCYAMTISPYSFPADLLIRADQRANYLPSKKRGMYTSVKAVRDLNRSEEVYCCVEPETHTMVVASGVLTGQCWWVPVTYEGTEERVDPWSDGPKPSKAFRFTFDRLMVGGGVGFGVSREFTDTFPTVKNRVNLHILCRKSHPNFDRRYMTAHKYRGQHYFRVPDSREGWAHATALLIDYHWYGREVDLYIDISDVRPLGAPIRGFGGTSSGPGPLVVLLVAANDLLNGIVGQKMRSVDALDLENLIARAVVSGGVRRSAEIAIGDADDFDFLTAKQDKTKLYAWRWASNNTVQVGQDTSDYAWDMIAHAIAKNGEPGVFNRYLAQNYGRMMDGFQEGIDAEVNGLNPCGEVTLAPYEPCNLIDIQPYIIWRDGERLGMDIKEACYLAARYTYRVTFARYNWRETQEVIERNRRTGVSLSGIVDWCLSEFGTYPVLGFKENGEPIFDRRIVRALDQMYYWVRKGNSDYAQLLGNNPSIKVTTVKPSGTVSLLPGVCPGIHASPGGAYYIRRIRFANTDPLLKLLKLCGYPMEPDHYAPMTTVVEFPVKAAGADNPNFKSALNLTVEEQFAMDYLLAYAWADNAVSCTITFKPHEAEKLPGLLRQYCKDKLKSTSLLPAADGDSGYTQLPYEPITKEEYERRVAAIVMTPEEAYAIYGLDDLPELDGLDVGECATGACPIK